MKPKLRPLLKSLRVFHGKPTRPVSTDPFHLILWEQVAYLVPDPQRYQAYVALRTQVGLTPKAILAASLSTLTAICRLGGSIAAPVRATRLRRSATMAAALGPGGFCSALAQPLAEARRVLAAFPMIGEPGADKILVFAGAARLVPLDSNALRVVQRLGLATEARGYQTSYRRAREALGGDLPRTRGELIEAYQLLRRHGREVCRRRAPHCGICPLRPNCRAYLADPTLPGPR
jgi:endonuclease III